MAMTGVLGGSLSLSESLERAARAVRGEFVAEPRIPFWDLVEVVASFSTDGLESESDPRLQGRGAAVCRHCEEALCRVAGKHGRELEVVVVGEFLAGGKPDAETPLAAVALDFAVEEGGLSQHRAVQVLSNCPGEWAHSLGYQPHRKRDRKRG
jgi:hypothetical protein